ncbi:hypothetical protein E1B28_008098 [Marasmius oreades]|uniref:Uncharacterized protein n=1 Tax=Marasmius oreades TaxID=181124 RepID=A0A9P7S309_9AGAR|nr:uncharacterized protein E1B28_008098 [Marasmius oreades]KAG7094499.1 hypothetical protein E1B28_008098 [Marasmius oreades]
MEVDDEMNGNFRVRRRTRSQQQQHQRQKDMDTDMDTSLSRPPPKPKSPSPSPSPPPPLLEDQMPPKMRKARIQREARALVEAETGLGISAGDAMAVDEDKRQGDLSADQSVRELPTRTLSQMEMPPPPVPIREEPNNILSTPPTPPRSETETHKSRTASPPSPPPIPPGSSRRAPSPSPATTFAQLSLVSPATHSPILVEPFTISASAGVEDVSSEDQVFSSVEPPASPQSPEPTRNVSRSPEEAKEQPHLVQSPKPLEVTQHGGESIFLPNAGCRILTSERRPLWSGVDTPR